MAVSPDGDTVIATSFGSNSISVITNGNLTYLSVNAPSWGVCFVDDLRAVVTVPSVDGVYLLQRQSPAGTFTPHLISWGDGSFIGCTEVIPGPGSDKVLIARRGRAPSGEEGWKHSVIELNVMWAQITKTFVTEREPRALALSPSGARLFVGTAQGALGGSGIATNHTLANTSFDGGSVVAYDVASGNPVVRFAIGSPVRGLAIWDPSFLGGFATEYRLFVTHAGEGGQSEDPAFGGRVIPNVVTSFLFDILQNHKPIDRQDVVFKHAPDLDPVDSETSSANLATVLPEKLVVRPTDSGTHDFELWVTNSASGTVTRAFLENADGSIVTSGTVDLLAELDPGDSYKVVLGRNGTALNTAPASTSNATVVFEEASGAAHIRVDDPNSTAVPFSSNPRGIAYDADNGRILVTTQFDHQLVTIQPGSLNTSFTQLAVESVSAAERNFFTFGRGFDFREAEGSRMVNNLSCGSCHVDGHLDGKIRLTVRKAGNMDDAQANPSKFVAVPSLFDSGNTEWMFFEGLVTIQDTFTGCGYCDVNDFFPDTEGFSNAVDSPASPWSEGGDLTDAQRRGRAWFDRFNCDRCHSSSSETFARTNDLDIPQGDRFGPLIQDSSTFPNLLHDATQSFITTVGLIGDAASLRNMTDVGTRVNDTNLIVPGVNTPALAGAWDNAPYLHDGRYRTLEKVLEHTWLNVGDDHRAAPVWTFGGPPDNFANSLDMTVSPGNLPLRIARSSHEFQTHSHARPSTGNWISVEEFFALPGNPGDGLADMAAYMRALSSQQDPCGSTTLVISNLTADVELDCSEVTVSWQTSLPVACDVAWGRKNQNPLPNSETTAIGTQHSVVLPMVPQKKWKAEISAQWCEQSDMASTNWNTLFCVAMNAVAGGTPQRTDFDGVYPNPFNPNTEIRFALANQERVALQIYDSRGRLIRNLHNGSLPAGPHTQSWDGRDETGAVVSSGVYHMRLVLGTQEFRDKLMLLK